MPFPFLTVDEIVNDFFQSLEDDNSSLAKARQGSRIYFLARAVASVIARGYQAIQAITADFFVSQSKGEALRRRVRDYNMFPAQGKFAAGAILAWAPPGKTPSLTAGDLLHAADRSLQFEVLSDFTLGSTPVHIPVMATDVGTKYNLIAGTPLYSTRADLQGARFLVSYNLPEDGVTPNGALSGGENAETDEEIKARFPLHLKGFARGVGYAVLGALKNNTFGLKVIGLKNATPVPGYFTIVTGNEPDDLTEEMRGQTATLLDEWAAEGIAFEFETLERRHVNIHVKVLVEETVSTTRSSYEAAVQSALTAMTSKLEQGDSLYLSKIISAAGSVPGVLDVTVLSPTTSVVVTPAEVVVADSVVVNAEY